MQEQGFCNKLESHFLITRNQILALGVIFGLFFSIGAGVYVPLTIYNKIIFGILYFILIFVFAIIFPESVFEYITEKGQDYDQRLAVTGIELIVILIFIGLGGLSWKIVELIVG